MTDHDATDPTPIDPDEAFLDDVFDRAYDELGDGSPVDPAAWCDGHPELLAAAASTIQLAEGLSRGLGPVLPGLPGYRILKELGRGGMGKVFLARREALGGRPVALKVLPLAPGSSEKTRERFLFEARALAQVRHPNIVAVHDLVVEEAFCAFSMEFVEGVTLDRLIEHLAQLGRTPRIDDARQVIGGALAPPVDASLTTLGCRIGLGLARALAAAHAAGILHRDVKPSNVFLRPDATPVLGDFGLARDPASAVRTESGAFLGTAAYASPEQLRGQHDRVDERSDVYSLGATLYEALTLRRPYSGATAHEILDQITSGPFVPPRRLAPWLPRELDTVVVKALDPDPGLRYASAAALAEDLQRVLLLEPILGRPRSWRRRVIFWSRRHGRLLAAGLAGILLSAAAIWFFLAAAAERAARPERARGLVHAARLALIEGAAFGARCPDKTLRRALADLEAAGRLLSDRRDLAVETAAVAVALDDPESPDFEVPPLLRESCPFTVQVLDPWHRRGGPPEITYADVATRDPNDCRALGLIAFLRAEIPLAMTAWAITARAAAPDPLLDATMGHLYLQIGTPDVAYWRLLRAAETWPESATVHLALAPCYLALGDFLASEQALARAISLGWDPEEPLAKSIRQTNLDRREAAPPMAEAFNEWLGGYREKPPWRLCLARAAARRGDLLEALLHVGALLRRDPANPTLLAERTRILDASTARTRALFLILRAFGLDRLPR